MTEHPAAPPKLELCSIDTCQRLDGSTRALERRQVGLEQGRARSLFFARVLAGRRELALRRQDPQRGFGPLGLLGRRPEGAGHAERGARDYHLGVDGVGLRDARGTLPRACFSAYPGR
ncbi:MAG: hypothetical protein ACLU7D_12320 [Collinsella sp.]